MVVEHSNSYIYNPIMRLLHYLKIDGLWYRGLCDKCLTPVQRMDQKYCYACVVRVKPDNFVHNRPHTEETKELIRQQKTKEALGYNGIHNWLRREYGVATECRNKLCLGKSSKFNWAKLGKEYIKDINNYTQLCTSCHVGFDRWGHEIEL